MAKNNKHWEKLMATEGDAKIAKEGRDPMEEGLKGISWFQNSKRIVSAKIKKTQETFGEEIGNSVTAGVLALYLLFLLPFASVSAYIKAPEGMGIIDSMATSAFVLFAFLANLFTTIYHSMKKGTHQKRVFRKLDNIMVYFAIFGVFAPICLSLVKGSLGLGILIAEGALAILGTLLTAIPHTENKTARKFAFLTYLVMGIVGIPLIKPLHAAASTACFWLIIAGVLAYIVGLFFYSGKKFKFSHMVWHLIVLGASACHVIAFVYLLR